MFGRSKKPWPYYVPSGLEAWTRCEVLKRQIKKAVDRHLELTMGMVADAAEPIDEEHRALVENLEAELYAIETYNAVKSARRWAIEIPPYPGPEWREPADEGRSYLNENALARIRSQIWERRKSSIKWWAWLFAACGGVLAVLRTYVFRSK